MKSILSKLVYRIEGYGEYPDLTIKSFRQDGENPRLYHLEIIDAGNLPPTGAPQETGDGKTQGASDESN